LFYNFKEAKIVAHDIKSGTIHYYFPLKPILDCTILDDGTLIILDGDLFAIKLLADGFFKINESVLHDALEIREISSKGLYETLDLYSNFVVE
jgi:hypothetical protein